MYSGYMTRSLRFLQLAGAGLCVFFGYGCMLVNLALSEALLSAPVGAAPEPALLLTSEVV